MRHFQTDQHTKHIQKLNENTLPEGEKKNHHTKTMKQMHSALNDE